MLAEVVDTSDFVNLKEPHKYEKLPYLLRRGLREARSIEARCHA